MPAVIALLGLITVAFMWIMRMRNAAAMTREIADVAQNVLSAAQRLGFRRRMNIHPVESIDDPKLAIGALGVAFLELGGLPTTEQQDVLLRSLQSHLGQSPRDAEETLILGRWLVTESMGPQLAIGRIARRLTRIDRETGLDRLMAVLTDVARSNRSGSVSDRQQEALTEIARHFHVS